MTARPYLTDSTGNIDLGVVELEDIEGNRSLIALADTQGNTKDSELASLLSGERIISLMASKKFTSYTDKDTFTQRMDSLWQGTKLISIKYYPFTIYNCYSGQAYYNVFVTRFKVSSTEVEEYFANEGAIVVHYQLEMKEGKGVGGTL